MDDWKSGEKLSAAWNFHDASEDLLTSDNVLRSVNGIRMNPTPVLAVLPTIKSPPVVSLTLAPGPSSDGGGAPLALNTEDLPTNVRSLDNVKKYSDTPGTFLDEVKRARHVKTTEREPAADWSVLPVQSRWGSAPQSFDTVCSDYFSRGRPDLGLGFGGRSSARRWTFLLHTSFDDYG